MNIGQDSRHEAILELSKGKLTTDASKHTGEGIFFTSRMFDEFSITSKEMCYLRTKNEDYERLIETPTPIDLINGTLVEMKIATNSTQTPKEVFEKYIDDEYRFSRTHVTLALARYEGENLISRSQARRLLTRIEKFAEVMLDFYGLIEIGQAFADEIFRVWAREHPNIEIVPVRMSPDVERMVRHAQASAREQENQPSSFPTAL